MSRDLSSAPGRLPIAVVVHYGDLEPTASTVAALRRCEPTIEIWLIDNQGEGADAAPAATRSAVDRWMVPRRNLGFGGAVDLAASLTLAEEHGTAILALNNDVELEPGAIAALAAELEQSPRTAAVTPRIVLAGGESDSALLWFDGGSIDWFRGSARVPGAGRPANEIANREPHDVDFATGCVLLLRLAALAEVGGFDRRYFLYEEDVELSLRLRAAGWRLRHVPAAVARHRGQASQRRPGEPFLPIHHPRHPRSARLIELTVSNRLLTARRHARGADRLRFSVGFPLYWTVRCLRATVAGRPGAWLAALRGLRRYRRLRAIPPDDSIATARTGEL